MNKLFKKFGVIFLTAALAANSFAFTACGHKHTPGNPVHENEEPATCTEDGGYSEVVYCTGCEEIISSEYKVIESTGHKPAAAIHENEVSATCTTCGNYDEIIKCAECNTEISNTHKTVEAKGHTPAEAVSENVYPSTCTSAGSYEEVVYCSDCETEISRTPKTTEILSHVYSEEYSKDASGHWYQCKTCTDKKDVSAHTPGPAATATEAQVCLDCGYVIALPVSHTHSPTLVPAAEATCTQNGNTAYYTCGCGQWFEDSEAKNIIDNHDSVVVKARHTLTVVPEKAPECLEDGNTEYYTCSKCEKWFNDENGVSEITNHNTVVVKATGHSFSDDWLKDETNHWHAATCEHDKEVGGLAEHEWNEGTVSGNNKTYTCTVCGQSKTVAVNKVTYNYNYTGAPAALDTYVEEGTCAVKPEFPVRAEYEFGGWYTEADCTTAYDFETVVTENVVLYALWGKMSPDAYVFEAEYTNLAGLKGKGYSNEAFGTQLIVKDGTGVLGSDEGPAKASNGHFISYFYVKGLTLTFNIHSDREVETSELSLRLSGELIETISLTSDEFLVKVNGEQLTYETIVIDNINTDMSIETKREFQDFKITSALKLKKGDNVITLTVNNTKKMQGAISCTAPLIDCIKIKTSAQLTWEPKTTNIK